MIVVSDASPLITLSNAGLHGLLPALFGRVLATTRVKDEVEAGLAGPFAPAWLEVADPAGPVLAAAAGLDLGEATAITLAVERSADLLLIDERKGRLVAGGLGLTARGALGVVIDAKRAGLIPSARDAFDELARVGHYFTPTVRADALLLAGETEAP